MSVLSVRNSNNKNNIQIKATVYIESTTSKNYEKILKTKKIFISNA